MKLLIIEDDEPKLREMRAFLSNSEYSSVLTVTEKMSYQSGLKSIMTDPPDVILLDMSIPTYDRSSDNPKGGTPKPFGGRDILREVRRKNLSCKVIIVTQFAVLKDSDREEKTFDELRIHFEKDFPDHFMGTVFYRQSESGWKEPLQKFLNEAVEALS